MKAAQLVNPTLLARRIMYKFGKRPYMVFTNNYEKCKTVKCYASSSAQANLMLGLELDNFLRDAGVVGHTIKRNNGSIIVRIPK